MGKKWVGAGMLWGLLLATLAWSTPALLPVQGRLTSVAGGPVTDGKYGIEFRLYDGAAAQQALWQEAQVGVSVSGGIFATSLGKVDPKNALPVAQIVALPELWLGVAVDGEAELPRFRLLSVPYALGAEEAAHAAVADALSKPIGTAQLAAGAVTVDKLAVNFAASTGKGGAAADLSCSGCVDGTEIAAGSIGTSLIADGAVTTLKLADGAVATAKIVDNAIDTSKLADDAVTEAKLATKSVTAAKLAVNWALADAPGGVALAAKSASELQCTGCVATADIADKAVTAGKLADSAVGTLQLTDKSVTQVKLADSAVGTAQLADKSVTAAKLADGAVPTLPAGTMVVSMSPHDINLLNAGYTRSNWALDLKGERTWKTHKPLPTGRLHPTVAVVRNRAYVIGGGEGSHFNGGLKTTEEYNPDTDTWTKKADMPTARGWVPWTVVNDLIYVAGGVANGGYVANFEVYDPATDKWTVLPPMPVATAASWGIGYSGKAYFFGGTSGATQIYDPIANKWTIGAATPGGGGEDHAVAELDGKLYVIGGAYNPDRVLMRRYDPIANTWETLPQVPSGGVTDGWAYVVGRSIYLWCGWDSFDRRLRVFDVDSQTWSVRDNFLPLPSGANGYSRFKIAMLNGRAYFIGGGVSTSEGVAYNLNVMSFGPVEAYLYTK
jgi:N-acetylneuraminic acid mutarotase